MFIGVPIDFQSPINMHEWQHIYGAKGDCSRSCMQANKQPNVQRWSNIVTENIIYLIEGFVYFTKILNRRES